MHVIVNLLQECGMGDGEILENENATFDVFILDLLLYRLSRSARGPRSGRSSCSFIPPWGLRRRAASGSGSS